MCILYPNVSVELSGQGGNGFILIARTSKALRSAGVPDEEIDRFRTEAMAGDYDNLLQTVMKWVETS